jgi:23S rRNA-/tRNA-specific pseudouridylate synthase
MGNKQSKAFQEGLEAMVESLANEEQERLDREAVAAANGEPNKDTEKENATLEKDETKDKKEQELSNKFIFNESYTELRVTNQKQYLKWRTVNLVHKGEFHNSSQ